VKKLVTLIVFGAAVAVWAGNWPGWRGSKGTGVAEEPNVPLKWSATENVRWKVELPEAGNSTPIIWGNRAFVTQAIAKGNQRTLMCFDRKTGKVLWQKGTSYTEKESTHESNPYCAASPVTDGERVIAWFASAGIFAYDLAGKELWKRELKPIDHEWGYGSSPIIHGDLCIFYHGPGKNSALIALDKTSGKPVWEIKDPPIQKRPRTDGFKGKEDTGYTGSFGSPIIAQGELIMSYPQLICAFDPKTGKELWRCDGVNELVYTSPIADDGIVVVMGGFGGTAAAVKQGGTGDVTKTHMLWRNERTKQRLGSGVIKDGHIYILNTDAIIECIELKTGKSLWQERAASVGPKSSSWSSMVLAGDRIYVLNQSGDTLVMKAAPKFEMIGINSLSNELTNASHAMADGEIFIRTHKHLWCIAETRTAAK
jgi:outer membrane protein assembly factor BamB